MKKKLLLSLAILVVALSNSFAQDRKNVIKVNLFSAGAATLNLMYEKTVTEKTSFQLDLAYISAKSGTGSSSVKYSGYQIQPEYRFYLGKKSAPSGFYVAPFLRYRSLGLSASIDETTYDPTTGFPNGTITSEAKATWNQFGGGVAVGAQWLFGNRVALNLFAGPAFYGNSFKYQGDANSSNFSIKGGSGALSFRSGLALGIAF